MLIVRWLTYYYSCIPLWLIYTALQRLDRDVYTSRSHSNRRIKGESISLPLSVFWAR